MKLIAAALSVTVIISPALAADPTPVMIKSDAGAKVAPDRMPSLMTSREIKAYNSDIERNHPYYISCRKDVVIGSLARKLRVCRTNEQWQRFSAAGNDESRAIMDDMSRAPSNGVWVPF